MSRKYRIRKVENANGDRYYPERRGLLWGWNSIPYRMRADEIAYGHATYGERTEENAKAIIDYMIAEDNEKEVIIDYP